MSASALPTRMNADEFLAWSMEQPEGKRYELSGGEIVTMASERSIHALAKGHLLFLLMQAVKAAQLQCQVYPDGMAVRVDADTIYEPDAMVRCGDPLPDDTIHVTDPVIVVEVISPSSIAIDTTEKLEGYFRLPSVQHYLVVRTKTHMIVHYRRTEDGKMAVSIVRDGVIRLDPPGIELRDAVP